MRNNFLLPFLILLSFQIFAQGITCKVQDSKTGESIPYASVKINDSLSLITNTEGYFTVPENDNNMTLTVSYLGYVSRTITISELKKLQFIIALQQGFFELETVNVSNIKPDPYKIMAEVKKNLERNYKCPADNQPIKEVLFYREMNSFKPQKLNFEITQATGSTKKKLALENQELNNFTSKLISDPPKDFKDMLCNYYTVTKKKDDKPVFVPKLEVVKAVKINEVSLGELEKKAMGIFIKHLDSTKNYRAKSGWFGTRDTVLSSKDLKNKSDKKNNEKINAQLNSSKSNLKSFLTANNPLSSHRLDFVKRPELYEYVYEGATYSNDNEFVYILDFKPKESSAKYTGKLYISEKDYAIQRVDYALVEGETVVGLNLKFILGVKFSQNFSKGTLVFKKNSFDPTYYLQYASTETGQYIYLHRPFKFIELTDRKDRDVVAFDIKVETDTKEKIEFLNISRAEITEADFENVEEQEFNYLNLKKYDPKIWKGLSIIEPLEEMKQYNVLDN